MKSATTFTPDIFDNDQGTQTFPAPGLTSGFKLELPILWEFPAFLGRASPLPAAKTIKEYHQQIKNLTKSSDRRTYENK
ncbi:MAG: hypothetical protein LBB26_04360 [Puniceicoccales bacterium]|jgi:hypothetical protein|nr:hypothetical protein [Puniceicoccales bacterium]